jgi:hypothetical protein
VKEDSAHVSLRPAQYLAAGDLAIREDWPASERLLARLRSEAAGPAAHRLVKGGR